MYHPPAKTFECHITIDVGVGISTLTKRLEAIGTQKGWKTSYIQNDPVLGNKPFFYFTKYNRRYSDLYVEMSKLASFLAERDYNVVREKIEAIVYDTKMGDKGTV